VNRPPPQEPRPGIGLFILALFFSPVVLLAWCCGLALLRYTGWRGWRLAVPALAGGALVVIVEGGPGPALVNHFAGVLALVTQFGKPILHLPMPGAFLWPQIPLAVPVGLLAAGLTRRPQGIVAPEFERAEQRRRQRAIARTSRRAVRLADRPEERRKVPALGVSMGGDLVSWRAGRYVILPDHAARLPRLVIGRTGAGKSVYLQRETYIAARSERTTIVLDGKGDEDFAAGIVDAYLAGRPGASVHLFPAEPLNVWLGGPKAQLNRLVSIWPWTTQQDWFKELAISALRLVLSHPDHPVTSSADLLRLLDHKTLARIWNGNPAAMARLASLDKDNRLADVLIRVGNLVDALGGLLDGTRAIGQADLTVVSLPMMALPEDGEKIFRVLMADLTHWASVRKTRGAPALGMVDEFSAVEGGRAQAIHLFERGRSAGVPIVLSGQSVTSLGDEDERDRLISTAGALVAFATSQPEELAKLAGSERVAEAAWQVQDGELTGRSTVTMRARGRVDPNLLRSLAPGEAVVIAGNLAEHMRVIRTQAPQLALPAPEQPPALPDPPHPKELPA
jgi:hypothetical protein